MMKTEEAEGSVGVIQISGNNHSRLAIPMASRRNSFKVGLLALGFASAICLSHASAATCEALKAEKIADTVIDSVEDAKSGYHIEAHAGMGNREITIDRQFCRIRGTIRPGATSNIKFEVWLPAEWNGSYYQGGNGGNAGSIVYSAMVPALAKGYAVAATDDGTSPPGNLEWRNDPNREADFERRAVHLTAVAGKKLAVAFYGKAPAHTYFFGGSKGGQEAMEEAQRYPEDFDGIVSNFPTIHGTYMIAYLMSAAKQMNREPGAELTAAKLLVLHNGVMAACGGKDGGLKTDSFLTYPPACRFDPAQLQCKGSDTAGCLTDAEIKTAAAIYAGPSNPGTGASLNVGAFRGGEAPPAGPVHGWTGLNGMMAKALGITNNPGSGPDMPNMDFQTFTFDKDLAALEAKSVTQDSGTWNADLRPFKARGGKLILTHGWDDPIVPPRTSLLYYDRVVADQEKAPGRPAGKSALEETRGFFRLFMVPGLGHGVSVGLQPVDTFAALVAWVEKGQAPDILPAAQYVHGDPSKGTILTRDICAWPNVGQADAAGAFSCRLPE